MYIPRHYSLEELVYPELYHKYKGSNKLLFLFDTSALISIDRVRDFTNTPVIINSYDTGYTESGYRTEHSKTGAYLSQHKNGRAFDLKFRGRWTPEKLREHMKSIGCFEENFFDRTDEEAYPFLLIKRIEWLKNMSWFHLDTFDSMHGRNCIEIIR